MPAYPENVRSPGVDRKSPWPAQTDANDPYRKPRFLADFNCDAVIHLNKSGPAGGRQPERYGFSSSSRGGTFRLEASESNISDADRSIAFAKQFLEIKD
jgi:hypothetical protein